MTHDEFIFKNQVLGTNFKYNIAGGVLHIHTNYICADYELPDNITFMRSLYIQSNLTCLPRGLTVIDDFFIIGNINLLEVPEDTTIGGHQDFGVSRIKELNHIKQGSTLNHNLILPIGYSKELPDDLTIHGYLDVSNAKLSTLPKNCKYNMLYCTKEQMELFGYPELSTLLSG